MASQASLKKAQRHERKIRHLRTCRQEGFDSGFHDQEDLTTCKRQVRDITELSNQGSEIYHLSESASS